MAAICICQDELPAAVLWGILSEGRQEGSQKKNGVGGSIWAAVATVNRHLWCNKVLLLIVRTMDGARLGPMHCIGLSGNIVTAPVLHLWHHFGVWLGGLAPWCHQKCMAWRLQWWTTTSSSVTSANLHSGWQLRHLLYLVQRNTYNTTDLENWCSASNLERGGGGVLVFLRSLPDTPCES